MPGHCLGLGVEGGQRRPLGGVVVVLPNLQHRTNLRSDQGSEGILGGAE